MKSMSSAIKNKHSAHTDRVDCVATRRCLGTHCHGAPKLGRQSAGSSSLPQIYAQQLLSALLFRTAVPPEKRQERAALRTCSADAGASPSALQGREMCSLTS